MLTIPTPYGVIFAALLVIWGAAYAVGMWRGNPSADRSRRLPLGSKYAMIAVVLLYGGLWLALAAGTAAMRFAWLICAGLLAGALGDLLLAGVFSFRRVELLALGIFGVGHLFYIAASLSLRVQLGQVGILPVVGAVGIGVVLAVVIWMTFVRNPGGSRTMNIASLIYGALLLVTVAIAALLWMEKGGALAILLVGIALFAVSDLLLAQYLIRKRGFPYIRDVVWLIYSAGQILIAFSIGAAIVLVR